MIVPRRDNHGAEQQLPPAALPLLVSGGLRLSPVFSWLLRSHGFFPFRETSEDFCPAPIPGNGRVCPEAIVAQILFSFCSGGVSLSDAGRLGGDKALGELLGMDRWAEETTIGEWLRGQNEAGLRELWSIIGEFVSWVLGRAKPARVRRGGELEVFFDDTQIEVEGKYFEGVAVNDGGVQSECSKASS
jgi:hypothetical protein